MAAAKVRSYRKILDCVWRPKIGHLIFSQVRYSRLVAIADGHRWSKKTYNNTISVLKRAFEFGYRDRLFHENPAVNLRCARLRKSDRPQVGARHRWPYLDTERTRRSCSPALNVLLAFASTFDASVTKPSPFAVGSLGS